MMNIVSEYATPTLLAVIIAAAAWYRRMDLAWRANRRTRQLRQAADMLAVHERSLAEFLDDPGAPVALKRLLIQVSDALSDRVVMGRVSEWAAARLADEPPTLSDEAAEIDAQLTALRGPHPGLADKFDICLLAGIAGGCLRWPETAARFDVAFPNLAVVPRRDATIAATAAGFRVDIPFSLKPKVAVPA